MKTQARFLFVILSIVFLASSAALCAENAFPDLTAQELKHMIDSGEPIFLLNPLPSLLFRQGHIPGSVNIRWHAITTSPAMPADKDVKIITYCMGSR
jgi:hypothetical protein